MRLLDDLRLPSLTLIAGFGLGIGAAHLGGLAEHTMAAARYVAIAAGRLAASGPIVPAISAVVLAVVVIGALMALDSDSRPAAKAKTPPQTKPTAADLKQVSTALEGQIRQILAAIRAQIDSGERHSGAMARAETQLGEVESADELREVVKLLIAANQEVQKNAQQMRRRFEQAENRVAALRSKLDVTERLAMTDPLTGVANRRHLTEELEQAVARSHESQMPLCLVMSDIDHFKSINDRFGHPAGDAVLKRFAELMRANVRASDLIGRYGGEEFAIVLEATTSGDAIEVVQRLRARLHATAFDFPGAQIGRVTASFGIAAVIEGENSGALIARADAMLYEAKNAGRDCYRFDSAAEQG